MQVSLKKVYLFILLAGLSFVSQVHLQAPNAGKVTGKFLKCMFAVVYGLTMFVSLDDNRPSSCYYGVAIPRYKCDESVRGVCNCINAAQLRQADLRAKDEFRARELARGRIYLTTSIQEVPASDR